MSKRLIPLRIWVTPHQKEEILRLANEKRCKSMNAYCLIHIIQPHIYKENGISE